MTEPPLELPSDQVRPSVVADRSDVFSDKLIGASGVEMIVAPLPADESTELPLKFVAKTLTETLTFSLNEYGADVRTDNGIVHYVAEIIVLSVPSQLTESSVYVDPSLYKIVTV